MDDGPKRDIEYADIEYADVEWRPNDYEWMDYQRPRYTDEQGRVFENGPGGKRIYTKKDGPGEGEDGPGER